MQTLPASISNSTVTRSQGAQDGASLLGTPEYTAGYDEPMAIGAANSATRTSDQTTTMRLVAKSFRGHRGKILRPLIGRAQVDETLRKTLAYIDALIDTVFGGLEQKTQGVRVLAGRNPTSPSLRYVGTTPFRKAERTIDA